jgi:hypothetical protein
MPVPETIDDEQPRDHHPIRAVDARGRVWSHHDPVALYRFIRARNSLLETIAAAVAR